MEGQKNEDTIISLTQVNRSSFSRKKHTIISVRSPNATEEMETFEETTTGKFF